MHLVGFIIGNWWCPNTAVWWGRCGEVGGQEMDEPNEVSPSYSGLPIWPFN